MLNKHWLLLLLPLVVFSFYSMTLSGFRPLPSVSRSTILAQATTVFLRPTSPTAPDFSPTSSPGSSRSFSTLQPQRSLTHRSVSSLPCLLKVLLCLASPYCGLSGPTCLSSFLWPDSPHCSLSSSHPGLISISCMFQVPLPQDLCVCCSLWFVQSFLLVCPSSPFTPHPKHW